MLPRLRARQQLLSNVPLPPGLLGPLTPTLVAAPGHASESNSPWSQRGRNSSFSRRNPPHPDTSFDSLRRRSASISAQLRRYHTMRQEALQTLLSRQHKKALALLLRRRFGVKYSMMEVASMTADEMTRRAVKQRAWKWAQKAARKMVNWLANVKFRRGVLLQEARSQHAARRIQTCWRHYRAAVIQPRQELIQRTAAAVCIQRWYRGYQARQYQRKRLLFRNVDVLHSYFERMRLRPLMQKAPALVRHWREYKQRKEAEKAKKAAARRVSKYFSGLVTEASKTPTTGDVFGTSSKAPPMRNTITRPEGLTLGKVLRKMKSHEPASPLTSGSKKLGRGRSMEPNTAPLKPKQRNSSRLARIEEVS